MKHINKIFVVLISFFLLAGCKKDWLDREPKNILTDEQIYNDPQLLLSVLANFYNRIPTDLGLDDQDAGFTAQWRNMANYDDAMWSGQSNEDWRNNIVNYYNFWGRWDYNIIRDINLVMENIAQRSTYTDAEKKQFTAELRFLRAYNYFELVKRMGGVPIVTTQLIYDFKGDPSGLQSPRAKEAEVYDFIGSEMDAIQNDLGNGTSKTRANKYTALALKSRAMLYAASLAKYNNLMAAPITTPGGEVGIPASRAQEYYQKSLAASQAIIAGPYSLYKSNPNAGDNFYEAVNKKASNNEVIFVKDYLSSADKRHFFSYDNIARNLREDNLGSSSITPSLNLVESYDFLDGSAGTLRTRTADNSDFIYYNNVSDIFANKDGRLAGTVLYPGATFKGQQVQMQAGVMVWNAATNAYQTIEGENLGSNYTDGGLLIGSSGPHRSIQEVSNTGFYLRKFIDAGAGTSSRGIRSDSWWIWFRLGEIYLNAAEAAFELNNQPQALIYINALRERAGFGASSLATLTIDKIRNERRIELAFEDHRLWDLKRWRIADKVWNGDAANPNTKVYALYPYRVIRPGDAARNNKYVFVKMVAPRFGSPRLFFIQNYYSFIGQDVLNSNPKIVKNPFQ